MHQRLTGSPYSQGCRSQRIKMYNCTKKCAKNSAWSTMKRSASKKSTSPQFLLRRHTIRNSFSEEFHHLKVTRNIQAQRIAKEIPSTRSATQKNARSKLSLTHLRIIRARSASSQCHKPLSNHKVGTKLWIKMSWELRRSEEPCRIQLQLFRFSIKTAGTITSDGLAKCLKPASKITFLMQISSFQHIVSLASTIQGISHSQSTAEIMPRKTIMILLWHRTKTLIIFSWARNVVDLHQTGDLPKKKCRKKAPRATYLIIKDILRTVKPESTCIQLSHRKTLLKKLKRNALS